MLCRYNEYQVYSRADADIVAGDSFFVLKYADGRIEINGSIYFAKTHVFRVYRVYYGHNSFAIFKEIGFETFIFEEIIIVPSLKERTITNKKTKIRIKT